MIRTYLLEQGRKLFWCYQTRALLDLVVPLLLLLLGCALRCAGEEGTRLRIGEELQLGSGAVGRVCAYSKTWAGKPMDYPEHCTCICSL